MTIGQTATFDMLHRLFALCLVALLALLSACGSTKSQTRVGNVQSRTEWAEDPQGPKTVIAGAPKWQADSVRFDLTERYTEREYQFTVTTYERRYVKEPDPLFAVATLGIVCVASAKDCFGKTGEWYADGESRSGKTATGTTRTRERNNTTKTVASVSWTGYAADGRTLGSRDGKAAGTSSLPIPVKSFAESLPERPDRIEVMVTLPAQPPARAMVEAQHLKVLDLYAEAWLPVEDRTRLYTGQLRERLLASDWKGANPVFAKLEKLGAPLPASFKYRYGENLIRSGDVEGGRKYLAGYIESAGPDGEFVEDAKRLMAK